MGRVDFLYAGILSAVVFTGCEPIVIELPGESPPPPKQEAPRPIFRQEPDGEYDCPDGTCPYDPGPINRLESALHNGNYHRGYGGSCAHVGVQDSLTAQGMSWLAADWRRRYGGPAGVGDIRSIAERYNLRYAYTTVGDVRFLQWCSRTRRPACIFYRFTRGAHAVTFVGFENGAAVLQDNNRVGKEIHVPTSTFLARWNQYGRECGYRAGVAFAVVGTPNPPQPTLLYAGAIP
jgi:hypothetical protein